MNHHLSEDLKQAPIDPYAVAKYAVELDLGNRF
jgi:hypothetical protein